MDDEYCTPDEKIHTLEHRYAESVTLDDGKNKFIGLWEGSFIIKNAKNKCQQVNESFFIYGIAGTGSALINGLSELPLEPVSSLFNHACTSLEGSATSEMLRLNTQHSIDNGNVVLSNENAKNDITDVAFANHVNSDPNASRKKSKHENIELPSKTTQADEIHLVGFGRNKFGRFSIYAVYNERSMLLRCEKKYITSKYKGLKRGRKPLSYHSSNQQESDEHHCMTTRPRIPLSCVKQFALKVVDNDSTQEISITGKNKRSFRTSKDFVVDNSSRNGSFRQTSLLQRLVTHPPEKVAVKYNDQVEIQMDPTYRCPSLDDESGEIYEGGWTDGKRNGKGVCLFADGLIYEGSWAGGVEAGFGQLMTAERRLVYSGEWLDGSIHGHGTYTFANGDKYMGDWKEGQRHGRGEYLWANGCKYAGEWKENRRHGRGVFTWDDDHSFYDGEWYNDMRHGKGLLIAKRGFRYDGYWHQNFFEGKGVSLFTNMQEYQGSFRQGLREGRGSINFYIGGEYEGRFKEDHMDGQGTIKIIKSVPGMDEEEQMMPIQIQADIKRIHHRAGFVDDLH